MKIGYKSDVGRIRENNEDSLLVIQEHSPDYCVFAVADGMGGHQAGEVASAMAIEGLKKFFVKQNIINKTYQKSEHIQKLINNINSNIYNVSLEKPELHGMGTTLTSVLYRQNQLYISHIGDSRVYRINDEGIEQLTEDHSLVAGLIREGTITKEQARSHPQKNVITRAIGTDLNVKSDTYHYTLQDEDIILLCTDGLSNLVSESEIKHIIESNVDLQEAANSLVQLANAKGGTDNITLIIFQC